MADIKKDFQKAVKAYRDTLPKIPQYYSTGELRGFINPSYPKAMFTEQQARKGTATVNCGWAGNNEAKSRAHNRAAGLLATDKFIAWCKNYGIKSIDFETNPDGNYQIRVRF